MDTSDAAPFVNFSQLQQHVQRRVRLVGSIENFDNSAQILQLKAADGGLVNVALRQSCDFDSKFICIEGTVDTPNSITEDSHSSFGDNFGERLPV